jgi:hypothetical protein
VGHEELCLPGEGQDESLQRSDQVHVGECGMQFVGVCSGCLSSVQVLPGLWTLSTLVLLQCLLELSCITTPVQCSCDAGKCWCATCYSVRLPARV